MIEYNALVNGFEVHAHYSERAVEEIFLPLLGTLTDLRRRKGGRVLAMLAAPPGAGKSTLLSFLEWLSRKRGDLCGVQVIGMDGFHRRQEYLLSHTVLRDGAPIPMAQVKGSPETFDLERLAECVRRVAAGEKCGWPLYDRTIHDPVEDAVTVDGDVVLLEGNYLLLDADGWRELPKFADYTVFVRADEALLRGRLIGRKAAGIGPARAARFVDSSDMPNVRACLERSLPADLELWIDADGDYHVGG